MSFPLTALIWFLCVVCPALSMAGDNLKDNRRQLEVVEQRIDETTKNLQEKREAGKKLRDDLQAVTREETRLRQRLDQLERESASVQRRLAEKTAQVEALRMQTSKTEMQVRQRLTALYKGGETGPMQLFFGAMPAARITENYDYFGRIVRRDRALLQEYRQQILALEDAQRVLVDLKKERDGALASLNSERRSLLQAVRLKEELLVRVRQEEIALGGQLAELKARAKRMSALIKKLESAKPHEYTPAAGAFAARKGSLPWPVAGRIRVGFGPSRNLESGTLQDSQGIEIEATEAQPIAAVWPGRVIFANFFKGFGKLLILDHGEGYYTLYAQATRLTRNVGDLVADGDVLAQAGGDGVYFEVRHHGVPLNPIDWLSGR